MIWALAAALLIAGASCGDASREASSRGPRALPKVVCTIGMIGDIAGRLAGTDLTVESLMGPGIDPHLYKASEGDVARLGTADLILYNGLMLEGKMGDILVKMARGRPVVAVAESVTPDLLREPPEFAGHYDPHIWFDVRIWGMTIDPIVAEFSKLVPGKAEEFVRRGSALKSELIELDSWVQREIAGIPEEQRVLITAHDAFGYMGLRYGLTVMGLQGVSTTSEAGIKDVERLVGEITKRKIRAIFVESSVPVRSIEAVQAAAKKQGHDVAIGGQLFSDAMGPAGTVEGTYVGMVKHNVRTIVAGLTGAAHAE